MATLAFIAKPAHATEETAFYQATDLAAAGRHVDAVAAFLTLVDRSPSDPFADDALAEAARLLDERLGDPLRAAATYERLVASFPASRLARRAAARAQTLRTGAGPGGRDAATLASFQEILTGFSGRPRSESIARMEALLVESPGFAEAPRARFWLGSQLLSEGRLDEALVAFRAVATDWPQSEWAPRARKAEGDVLLAAGDLDGAVGAYRALARDGGSEWTRTVGEAIRRVQVERWRARGVKGAWVVVGLFLAGMLAVARRGRGSWRQAVISLARPPIELWYLLPVALLFVAASLTENGAIARAVAWICAGALVITWLSGAALDATSAVRPRLAQALAHAGAAAATMVAICAIAVVRERLVDLLVETIRFGVER